MKSLLFVVPALPNPATTGGEIFNQRLADGLPRGFKVTVVTLSDLSLTTTASPEVFAQKLADYARAHVAPGPVFIDTYLYRHALEAMAPLRSLGFGPFTGFGQAWYPGRYRGLLSRLRVRLRLMRFLRLLDHHVVVSESLKADYVRHGVARDTIDVALPGFDLLDSVPERRPRSFGPLRVCIAGTYMEAKGQHLLVEAVERLAAQNTAIGDVLAVTAIGPKTQAPEYVRGLEARAARLPKGVLTLNGSMSQQDLWRAFSDTDVFVFPASGEGLGMVLVEAMLCGAFPVVSPDGPLREVVGEGGVAGLVVPRAADAIARTLIELARDLNLESRQRAAIARARSLAPSWDQTIERVARTLHEVSDRVALKQDGLRVGPTGRAGLPRTAQQAVDKVEVVSGAEQARGLPY